MYPSRKADRPSLLGARQLLSQKAKYALRALLMLAQHDKEGLVLVADIAEQENVPKKFLELILLDMKKHGLLHSQRGKGGGYCLSKPPSEITLGQVIRIMDGPLAPLPCASVTGYRRCSDCRDERTCSIRKVMRRVRDAMADILDNTTLAEAAAGEVDETVLSDAI
jgi:Rrf2 family protein